MKIAVIGLGYVGLPLAVALSKHYKVMGYDKNPDRTLKLFFMLDETEEVNSEDLKNDNLDCTCDLMDIADCDFYIVAVPTPTTIDKLPDLTPLKNASTALSTILNKGDIVVYESTVNPGVTENICIPILEQSGLKCGVDFNVGYSPERINPGDKVRTLTKITKVVSAQNEETLNIIYDVYSKIIEGGVHKAPTIMTAEACKILENIQRDVNIALINEVSILFNKLGIDTYEVLRAAKTKWNFNNYYPGMVGGHCIGVDPYYLIHQAKEIGIDMKVMRSAREVNEGIAPLVAEVCSKRIKDKNITEPKILVLGATFKENCSDTRNSKAMELIEALKEKYTVSYFDPYLGIGDEEHLLAHIREYDVVVLAVSHDFFKNIKTKLMLLLEDKIVIDVKGLFKEKLQGTSNYWKL